MCHSSGADEWNEINETNDDKRATTTEQQRFVSF